MSEGIKALVGRKMSRKTKFMGTELVIEKLTVSEVLDIQAKAKDAGEDESAGLELLKSVIRSSAEGGIDLSDEDFDTFPIDELTKLSGEIMKFSGMSEEKGK
ncbi:MAG: hypothetical protein DRQ62_00025 [Gammaproteobacteria bacterium]|nr:MAG: hypothetical protein DRQ62_00025 [Gammaproteobacteria bacterium]